MGIKGFAAWLRATFPQVFCAVPVVSTSKSSQQQQILHFDQVYVDLNPFLHIAARQSANLDELIRLFRKNLKNAVGNTARPGSLVYVSMDGPAPLAKLPEQRSRRQDSAISAARRCTFDAQQFTPGCLAMTTIEAEAYSTIRDIFFSSGSAVVQKASQSSDFRAIIDGTGVEGEGEFKIIRYIINDHINEDALKGRVTRAILALDADLFLQALLSEVPHLYLLDPFAPYQSPTTVFSVDRWRRALSEESLGIGAGGLESRLVAFDFVLFALMSGSDYLQALRYVNYRSLWPAYLDFIKCVNPSKRTKISSEKNTIVDPVSKSINFAVMKDFFSFYLKEKLADSLREPLRAFHADLDPSSRNDRVLNYAEHLIWNLDALVTCNVPDLSISLLQPEKQIPSLIDLSEMDADVLQGLLDDRLKHPKRSVQTEQQCKYPGVTALMALDRSTDCEEYLAAPLRPIMRELKDESSDLGRIRDDSVLVKDLRNRIDSTISKSDFSMVEKLATFPRDPIFLDKQAAASADGANFYSMALKGLSVKSENANDDSIMSPVNLPWIRPYVYIPSEEESWKCPLHRLLFSKYRVNKS